MAAEDVYGFVFGCFFSAKSLPQHDGCGVIRLSAVGLATPRGTPFQFVFGAKNAAAVCAIASAIVEDAERLAKSSAARAASRYAATVAPGPALPNSFAPGGGGGASRAFFTARHSGPAPAAGRRRISRSFPPSLPCPTLRSSAPPYRSRRRRGPPRSCDCWCQARTNGIGKKKSDAAPISLWISVKTNEYVDVLSTSEW